MSEAGLGGTGGSAPRGARSAPRTNVAALEACYQLLLWLIPTLEAMPRRQKFQIGDRLQEQAQQVMDLLIEAAYTRERSVLLPALVPQAHPQPRSGVRFGLLAVPLGCAGYGERVGAQRQVVLAGAHAQAGRRVGAHGR